MATWVGLIGVLAGALIAFGGQYIMNRNEMQERDKALILEQCALVVSLSEDYLNRAWEERSQLASDIVREWDIGTYLLAPHLVTRTATPSRAGRTPRVR